MASYGEPAVARTISKKAEKDAESLDWLSIPVEQRIISDDWLEAFCDVPKLDFLTDFEDLEERKENVKPIESGELPIKRFKASNWYRAVL